jgi:hypothetical protein
MKNLLSLFVIIFAIAACTPQEVKDTMEYVRDVHPKAKMGKAKVEDFRMGDLLRFLPYDKTPHELVTAYLYGDTTKVLGKKVTIPVRFAGQNMECIFFYDDAGKRIDGDLFVSQ